MGREFANPFILGGYPQFDRSVLYLDNFDGYRNWNDSGDGGDYNVDTTNASQYMGTEGLIIQTRTTSPAQGDYAKADRYISFPENNLITVRGRVGFPDISKVSDVQILFSLYRGDENLIAGIEYEPNTPKLYYQDSGATWTEITGYTQAILDGFWTTFEFQFDLADEVYKYAIFNGIKTDMSASIFTNTDATGYRACQIQLLTHAAGAASAYVYFDNLLVTQDLNL